MISKVINRFILTNAPLFLYNETKINLNKLTAIKKNNYPLFRGFLRAFYTVHLLQIFIHA
jgi:hypothetical protein